jgi:spore coat polysaccharide biosynthesis protein SpsF (cytidylyltransferase family)
MGKKINIGCIITVPLDPTASKIVLTEFCGRPALQHLLDRVKSSWYLDHENIVLCCRSETASPDFKAEANEAGIRFSSKSHPRPIDAITYTAGKFKFDIILHVDATHPLTDPLYMDLAIERILTDDAIDMAQTIDLPVGTEACCLSRGGVELLVNETERPGAGGDALEPGPCKWAPIHPMCAAHHHHGLHLTLNNAHGIETIHAVFKKLYKGGQIFGVAEVIGALAT